MADKKLNVVSTASDGAYIYAEDASGNQIKISKADLATVVAGVISPLQYVGQDKVTDCNNCEPYKGYFFSGSVSNCPSGYTRFNLLCIGTSWLKFQIAANENSAYIRFFYGAWGGWSNLV